MRRSLTALLGYALVLSAAAPAVAQTALTFEDASPGTFVGPYVEGGYTFTYTPGAAGFAIIGNPANCNPPCASNGTNAFYNFNSGFLHLAGGGASGFTLFSFDAAQTFTTDNRILDISVTGNYVLGGTVMQRFTTLPGAADVFQTFLLGGGFTGLASVTIAGFEPYPTVEFAVDDFVVSATATVVPEPVSLALLGTGLVGLAAVRRRRRGPAVDTA